MDSEHLRIELSSNGLQEPKQCEKHFSRASFLRLRPLPAVRRPALRTQTALTFIRYHTCGEYSRRIRLKEFASQPIARADDNVGADLLSADPGTRLGEVSRSPKEEKTEDLLVSPSPIQPTDKISCCHRKAKIKNIINK
ncbi:hypothetical protein HPP92_006493 [Vanilla planifolia]|uniref:Uncharacterized protein n=1 Tax=Vanilla planifolia TaxID=51239 RepID=A0A835RK02_VANPL|nr:hypothetical protein HPP92_006493 [Vanilla planifolia]